MYKRLIMTLAYKAGKNIADLGKKQVNLLCHSKNQFHLQAYLYQTFFQHKFLDVR
jgi:hypothetical protein